MASHFSRRTLIASAAAAAIAPAALAADLPAAARYSAERRGVSLLVMQAGQVVFEDYPSPGGADAAWELASGTKSFCGIMAAAAAHDGLLGVDELCVDTLSEWRADDRKRRITIRHLLTLTSGLSSGRIARPPTYADAIATQTDVAPDTRFIYGPAPFQTFGEIMRRKLSAAGRDPDPLTYLQARIFDSIGVRPQRWRRGVDGNPHLPSGAALTARDWARFGHFVLEASAGRASTPPLHASTLAACFEGTRPNPGYGLSWWLLRPGLVPPGRANMELRRLTRREDIRMAAGAGNQRLYLIPAREMVIVRQATGILAALTGRGANWSDGEFLDLALG